MAIEIGIGLSTQKDTLQATNEAIQEARLNLNSEKIDLVLVFSSIEFAQPATLKIINSSLGQTPIIGCSSLAIISNHGILKYGLLIMLIKLPEGVYFNSGVVREISNKSMINSGEDLSYKLLYGFKNIRRDLAIFFSDGIAKKGSDLLLGLSENLGRSFPIVGASASDNLLFKKTFVYFNEETVDDAVCGVLLGGKIKFAIDIKHGWKPLGKPRYVTHSNGNIVYEINGRPAVQTYQEYFGPDLFKLKKGIKRLSILYPLGVYLPEEDGYLLRNAVSVETNGAIVFQDDVPNNSQVRLMIGTKESCLNATKEVAESIKKNMAGQKLDFVLVFDSISRYILLGRQAEIELQIIKQVLGEKIPIVGIYTYGEQAPLKAMNYQGKTYFHNQSIAILGIGS